MTLPGALPAAAATVIHRLAPEAKILALIAFAVVVVATPARLWPAYLVDATLLIGVAALARLSAGWLARRAVIELPVLVFVAVLPLVASGPRVEVLGVGLSEPGLAASGTLLAKATLGVYAAVILAATTPPRELLTGLERLRLPAIMVAILTFMVRYAVIMTEDLRRLRLARLARGGSRRGQLAAVAGGAGLLFVRAYERGERVHLAMLARGYQGRMPALGDLAAVPRQPPVAAAWSLLLPAGAVLAALATALLAGGSGGSP
ncbi:MAG: cobalt ECF transporter T component CbiQ [Austwickia sp.]|nr:cobalt ECF transporter T component CbiQ [Austwickia sp.]